MHLSTLPPFTHRTIYPSIIPSGFQTIQLSTHQPSILPSLNHIKMPFASTFNIDCTWVVSSASGLKNIFYYTLNSEILEFPSVINFDIITSDDINFDFHFLP